MKKSVIDYYNKTPLKSYELRKHMTKDKIIKNIRKKYNLKSWNGWNWIIVTEDGVSSDEDVLYLYICKDEPIEDNFGYMSDAKRILGSIPSDKYGIKKDMKISKKEIINYGEYYNLQQ